MNPDWPAEDENAESENAEIREVERRMNIHRLKNEFTEITGEIPDSTENPDAPAELIEKFWEGINEYERAPESTLTDQWERNHEPLPSENELDDEQIHVKLWEIIEWMAARRTYLEDTDHLSDRQLYVYLYKSAMKEWMKEFSPKSRMNTHISPIGSGSEEHNEMYMRFYADDSYRENWAQQFPDSFIPEKEKPLYDRDRLLPQHDYFAEAAEMAAEEEFDGEDED